MSNDPLNSHTLRGQEIVCVGFAEWNPELPTNQHHLMSRLAQTNRVLFVESLGLRRPQLATRDVRRVFRRLRDGLRGSRTEGDMHVLSPIALPAHGYRILRLVNGFLLRRQVGNAVARLGFDRPILWGYVPHAEVLLENLDPSLVIYHCVDDLAAQKGVDAKSFRAAEQRFATRADLVLASAPSLSERLRLIAGRVLDAPNVADVDFFSTALEEGRVDEAVAGLPPPRIVFTGAIVATKVDTEWLAALARMRPHWSFALVGPVGLGDPGTDISALRSVPNIHLLGPRPYRMLPDVLRGADAAIVPYALNALTASVFPMKVYEYLAAGLPVVSTPLPALDGLAGLTIVRDVDSAATALGELMAEDSRERRRQRSSLAHGHSWTDRLAEIAAAVHALRPMGESEAGDDNLTLALAEHQ
jgi:glycosyltransferase involved in cell wall biosynthesis